MKKTLCLLLVMLVLCACLLTGCGGASANGGRGEVIGSVNGVDVYKGELDYYMNYQFSSYYNNYYSFFQMYYNVDLLDEESAKDILGDMEHSSWQYIVEAELILQIAEQYGISFAGEYLEDVLSWGDYRMLQVNSVYNDLYYAVEQELVDAMVVSEEDAKAAYDEDPSAWNGIATSHILIMCDVEDEAAKAEAYAKAADLIDQLNKGADFATLAQENSDDSTAAAGGVFDVIFDENGDALDGSTSLYAEYSAAAWQLANVGDYTLVPVLSPAGYHIIKLDAKYDSFESAKEMVMESLKTASAEDVEAALSEKVEAAKASANVKEMTYKYYTPSADSDEATAETEKADSASK